jgi:hypothetical protein
MTREVRACFAIAFACFATGNLVIGAVVTAIGVGLHRAEQRGDNDDE